MIHGWESGMAKIVRALEHYKPVEDCIADYARRKPYRKVAQPNGPPTLEITEQPPIEISVFSGEIIYQLRSALDHFFFDLIERNGAPLTSKQIHSCIFPLRTERPVPGSVSKGDLLLSYQMRIPDEAFTLIEGLQPYNRIHHGHTLLRMLTKFSNIDKHRYLVPTVLKITRTYSTTSAGGGIRHTTVIPMLDHGAKLYDEIPNPYPWAKNPVKVEDEYALVIAFDEPEFGPPQIATIEELTHALPTFVFRIGIELKKFLC